MPEPSNDYILLDTRTLGGPTGDYFFDPDMDSADWLEYRILAIANGATGPTYIQCSGTIAPTPLAFDGTKTINNVNAYPTVTYTVGANNSPIPPSPWIRIVNQIGVVFIRIDTPVNNACYISVQARSRILKKIPAPFKTVAPENERLVSAMREARIQQAVLGQSGEEIAYGSRPIETEPIRPQQTERQPVNKLGYWGRVIR